MVCNKAFPIPRLMKDNAKTSDSPAWIQHRSTGLLLHVSSLPGSFGIGNLGPGAHDFLEFLVEAGFSSWQTCPLGPTGFGDSPYQTFSSDAGNPYFIDWEPLLDAQIVSEPEITSLRSLPTNVVDYDSLRHHFLPISRQVSKKFHEQPTVLASLYGDFSEFVTIHERWLRPYCLFKALKESHDGQPWWAWPIQERSFDAANEQRIDESLRETIQHEEFLQYVFFGQWDALRRKAHDLGLRIIGDLPIYAAPDGAEVWARPELFQLGEDSLPSRVSGVPPDYFAPEGQRWGNPLYDWPMHQQDGFSWWLERLEAQLQLFDVVRIDHFRAFHDYWSIPATANDARLGEWEKGPGLPFFEAVRAKFPAMPFLAEDLGLLNAGVHQLRDTVGLPGMAVLQFAFDGDSDNLYLPHNLNADTVLYVGTHDNDVAKGWYESASEEVRDNFRRYLNTSGEDAPWDFLRAAYRSVAKLTVVTAQDLLSLGSEARFNVPGTPTGNWRWRITPEQFGKLRDETAPYLREQAQITGRSAVVNPMPN